jgi:hypothetical protein
MAPKKGKAAAESKTLLPRNVSQNVSQGAVQEQMAGQQPAEVQRLLREAAWSRMFGRVEMKNPFTRSR